MNESFDQSRNNIPHVYQEAFEVLPTFLETKGYVPVFQDLKGNNHAGELWQDQICLDEILDVVSESK